ncbi:MAG: hypothetical protein ACJA2Q_001641 [Pseudohongiellaceae bacterium]|jgi:hypothetical protein
MMRELIKMQPSRNCYGERVQVSEEEFPTTYNE